MYRDHAMKSLMREASERGVELHRPDGSYSDAGRALIDERVARKRADVERAAFDEGVRFERDGDPRTAFERDDEKHERGCPVFPSLRRFFDAGREAVRAARRGEHPLSFDERFGPSLTSRQVERFVSAMKRAGTETEREAS